MNRIRSVVSLLLSSLLILSSTLSASPAFAATEGRSHEASADRGGAQAIAPGLAAGMILGGPSAADLGDDQAGEVATWPDGWLDSDKNLALTLPEHDALKSGLLDLPRNGRIQITRPQNGGTLSDDTVSSFIRAQNAVSGIRNGDAERSLDRTYIGDEARPQSNGVFAVTGEGPASGGGPGGPASGDGAGGGSNGDGGPRAKRAIPSWISPEHLAIVGANTSNADNGRVFTVTLHDASGGGTMTIQMISGKDGDEFTAHFDIDRDLLGPRIKIGPRVVQIDAANAAEFIAAIERGKDTPQFANLARNIRNLVLTVERHLKAKFTPSDADTAAAAQAPDPRGAGSSHLDDGLHAALFHPAFTHALRDAAEHVRSHGMHPTLGEGFQLATERDSAHYIIPVEGLDPRAQRSRPAYVGDIDVAEHLLGNGHPEVQSASFHAATAPSPAHRAGTPIDPRLAAGLLHPDFETAARQAQEAVEREGKGYHAQIQVINSEGMSGNPGTTLFYMVVWAGRDTGPAWFVGNVVIEIRRGPNNQFTAEAVHFAAPGRPGEEAHATAVRAASSVAEVSLPGGAPALATTAPAGSQIPSWFNKDIALVESARARPGIGGASYEIKIASGKDTLSLYKGSSNPALGRIPPLEAQFAPFDHAHAVAQVEVSAANARAFSELVLDALDRSTLSTDALWAVSSYVGILHERFEKQIPTELKYRSLKHEITARGVVPEVAHNAARGRDGREWFVVTVEKEEDMKKIAGLFSDGDDGKQSYQGVEVRFVLKYFVRQAAMGLQGDERTSPSAWIKPGIPEWVHREHIVIDPDKLPSPDEEGNFDVVLHGRLGWVTFEYHENGKKVFVRFSRADTAPTGPFEISELRRADPEGTNRLIALLNTIPDNYNRAAAALVARLFAAAQS